MQGPLKAPSKANSLRIFLDFSGPYGPMRAHVAPYWPVCAHMGSARALEERERFRKNAPFSLLNACFSKIVVFDLHMTFFDGFNVFFRCLAEIRFRTIMKLLQKQVLELKRAVFVPPSPCLK